jgi:hypothetical protein
VASERLRELYRDLRRAVAFVEVEDRATRDVGIGTAFHVGEGVFITAAHVVRSKRILKVGNVHATQTTGGITLPPFTAKKAKVYLPDASDLNAPDVAAVVVDFKLRLPALQLGAHLDNWLADDEMTLSRALVMGFPPVPFADRPHLLAVTCEVNAHVGLRGSRHPHFLISSMARGGFSGGPVVHEDGFVLGVVTESLIRDQKPEELGFMTVLTVEPIYALLQKHKLLPKAQDADVRSNVIVAYTYKGDAWSRALKGGHYASRKAEALELFTGDARTPPAAAKKRRRGRQ